MIKLDQDETLITEVRKHSFVFFVNIMLSVIFALLPLIGVLILDAIYAFEFTAKIYWLEAFGYSLWLLIVWVVYFVFWTDYYLDAWYVTDKKIYDVLQNGFFDRQVSILHLDNIQDITIDTRGIIQTLLGFGDIHVQTAGENSKDFTMRDAKDPNSIKDIISGLHERRAKI